MPPAHNVFTAAQLRQSLAMNTQPLTPPSDSSPFEQRMRPDQEARSSHDAPAEFDDNTAAGMALSQEESMYLTPAQSPVIWTPEELRMISRAQPDDVIEDGNKQPCQTRDGDEQTSHQDMSERSRPALLSAHTLTTMPDVTTLQTFHDDRMQIDPPVDESTIKHDVVSSSPRRWSPTHEEELPCGLSIVDTTMDRASTTPCWDFSDKRPSMRCPSALLQPYAKYVGTQQSDRQTYNVEVTILTVDMDQCSLSGYLMIRGLTPEHPMLQTFFTGEIVGGPNQRYSFKTMDPGWGASDKVDLQHWLRFPAWRQLTSHAKRDMAFEYPLNDEPWYDQEHIFMRWKEHFLVPDHKQSNIQGASFEGFYYICLNQIEGKISGVYFHSKSEKYQQLELTHVTKKGLGVFPTSPLIELR